MNIHGKNHIGFQLSGEGDKSFQAFNPETGEQLPENFHAATEVEIEEAISLAERSFLACKRLSANQRANFLDAIAEEILNTGDELIQRAMAESGLPEGRLIGERGRTVNQLKMFAGHIRKGDWVEASIDTAEPEREPMPKPDLRMMRRPIGPVVVFTASNFPLAFSTAGGDTASALAAGNPVIVKSHESHPGTNSLVADAIIKAAKNTGMPEGIFSSLQGIGYKLGESLVKHPAVKSVAFTGSFKGGMALHKMASEREEPIPVFAEMGSINPSFILKNKLAENPGELGKLMASSVLLGAGQFCTNPGLILVEKSEHSEKFIHKMVEEINRSLAATMLNTGILNNYESRLTELSQQGGVVRLNSGKVKQNGKVSGTLALVSASDFIQNPSLQEEIFGPFSLIVEADNMEEMEMAASTLAGQLTATIWLNKHEMDAAKILFDILEDKAGRILTNGVPTGVEVTHSMQHGGPFPASTDSRFTSVGTDAIKRFSRPVCWQNCPDELLPEELKSSNPLKIWRRINGKLEK